MSGGHWNYIGDDVREGLRTIADDAEAARRWPMVAGICGLLSDVIHDAEHGMDWDLSGDTIIHDDEKFDRFHTARILEAVLKCAPDGWFPRGKWATIQAVQSRSVDPKGAKPA